MDNPIEAGSTIEESIGDMLPRLLACAFLRYSFSHHLKEASIGFARG